MALLFSFFCAYINYVSELMYLSTYQIHLIGQIPLLIIFEVSYKNKHIRLNERTLNNCIDIIFPK